MMNLSRAAGTPCAKFSAMLRRTLWLLTAWLAAAVSMPAQAQGSRGDDTVLQAREALRKRDKATLASARMAVNNARHPLAMWVEYWELLNRLQEAQQPELDAFWSRWGGTYVEDRLRNDWLLELGRRRDWANFRAEFPRFRMNDDREVTCYALLTQHLDGQDVRNAARAAWWAQKELDDGCNLLARSLFEARVLSEDDAWQEARLSVEANRPRPARAAAALINPALGERVGQLLDDPVRFLARRGPGAGAGKQGHELQLLALMRMAGNDPEYTAGQLQDPSLHPLPVSLQATAWAHTAKQAALKQLPQAGEFARQAWKLWDAANKPGMQPPWSEELLAWHVRAALREPGDGARRWSLVARAIDAMPAAEQRDAAWVYWKARAGIALAPAGAEGDAVRAGARAQLEQIAPQLGFYGKLATEALGQPLSLPATPAPLSPEESTSPRSSPGFARALQLIGLGLRSEGVREWNYTLRGLDDRQLLAAAQLACDSAVWDRCINTSDRTRGEVDLAQRFPTPYREQVLARAREAGLDPAVLYGLIRQESRFITDARSGVGASGLMQLMPGTARWAAKKLGVEVRPEQVTDTTINLQLGAFYLKRMLDDFGGSLAMAAAAYNAGPGRPRKWREGPAVMEPAAWAECIPFNETRDYVKKVLSNSVYYAALLAAPLPPPVTLKSRLGPPIGPREPGAAAPDRDLP
jgi:soluble lytic murein transglycosylase